jgi:cell division protein FtsI/penicillin-binding protein 2
MHVVETGPNYARETLIPGFKVGGKTGTAQIWDAEAGQWAPNLYNHTFAGFVGRREPEVIIVVRIHEAEPRVEHPWGMGLEMSSNELFRRIAQDAVQALDIPPLDTPEIVPDADP